MPSGDHDEGLETSSTHHLVGNFLEQARMFMVSDACKVRQLPFLPLSPHPRGYYHASSCITEEDAPFLERATASTILPDRGMPAHGLSCGGALVKGVGYGGGGFTEMIRGITHLPTAADVQSLMQARSGTQGMDLGVMSASAENIPCGRMVPPVCTEACPQRSELHPPEPIASPSWNPVLPPRAEDCTLSLLPNIPTRPLMSTANSLDVSLMHDSSLGAEPRKDHSTDFLAGFASMSSSGNSPVFFPAGRKWERGQLGSWKQAKHMADEAEETLCSGFLSTARSLDRVVPSCAPSALSYDGTTVDQVYLQQAYGGSTDPVLLVDDSGQVLWFNKAYDRALRSVSDRSLTKPAKTGPYIDPLGHPTPLGSLALSRGSDISKTVNATLWGFLRKLVMPEVVSPPSMTKGSKPGSVEKDVQSKDQESSKLSLSVGERWPQSLGERLQQSITHACSSSSMPTLRTLDVAASDGQGCGGVGKLTTVTLESITEVFMGEGVLTLECVEMAEAKLEVAGSVPAFITDCTSRVRWVNTAFKQILGHLEQQGNNFAKIGPNSGATAKHEPPDLTFVCLAEKIPRLAWAFSGLVNLEWVKAGRRRSMTVPCDVSRLVPAATWVWKFDVALSLSLNLCV